MSPTYCFRSFLADADDVLRLTNAYAHKHVDLAIEAERKLVVVASTLHHCCSESSQSAITLIKSGNSIFDAIVLLRKIIDGTAKFCYLLSPKDREEKLARAERYNSVAKKDYRSFEQPVRQLFKEWLNSKDSNAQKFASDLIVDIQERGASDFGVDISRAAAEEFSYRKLSHKLSCENVFWHSIVKELDLAYALSNPFVHMNAMSASVVFDYIFKQEDDAHRASIHAMACDFLRIICELAQVRVLTLAECFGWPVANNWSEQLNRVIGMANKGRGMTFRVLHDTM